MRNLHIEILRQFHMQEVCIWNYWWWFSFLNHSLINCLMQQTEMSAVMNSILENQAELMKEVKSLRQENQQLRQMLWWVWISSATIFLGGCLCVLSCGVFCFFCKLTIDVWPAVSFWLRLLAFSWWWLKKNIMRELLCTRNRALKRLWKCTGWWFFQLQKLCWVIYFMFKKNLFILVNYIVTFFSNFLENWGGKRTVIVWITLKHMQYLSCYFASKLLFPSLLLFCCPEKETLVVVRVSFG